MKSKRSLVALLIPRLLQQEARNPTDQEADAHMNYSAAYHGGRTALVVSVLFVWSSGKIRATDQDGAHISIHTGSKRSGHSQKGCARSCTKHTAMSRKSARVFVSKTKCSDND